MEEEKPLQVILAIWWKRFLWPFSVLWICKYKSWSWQELYQETLYSFSE